MSKGRREHLPRHSRRRGHTYCAARTRSRGRAMYQPEAYAIALLFMIGSMLCWGSWANTMKLTPGWAFQLFYWDYVIGIVAAALLWGFTLGSVGGGELS